MMILDLPPVSTFWYVATPYSLFPEGLEAAFVEAARIRGWLVKAGIRCFSPIVHSHPAAIHGGLDPFDHAIWLPDDRPMMDLAGGLLVAMLPSWRDSKGIAHEIEVFVAAGKPIRWLSWLDGEVVAVRTSSPWEGYAHESQ